MSTSCTRRYTGAGGGGEAPPRGRTEDTAVTKQTGGAQKALPCTGRMQQNVYLITEQEKHAYVTSSQALSNFIYE
ncbi:hypothetical protein C0Q70_05096 [Pomacea canaliculata]|uniref:Uncharacterized protein n=1 Tax=Pomacea canaliculata TaxID=400727 RepID=A0A2T7PK73_POMCA|nr:hypothetical protein C0Q70_05096 [Pomacea canaliculata]